MEKCKLQIPKAILEIVSKLNEHYEVYFVGGCVRDTILNREVHDFDCTTIATVDEMKEVLCSFKIIETGIKHGTLTILNQDQTVEITTYRIDKDYVNHRRPTHVEFTRNLHEDLNRRDFTINALACDLDGNLVDDFGGLNDLKNGLIRCVENPQKRFDEDALRILRAIRFSCQLGFKIEDLTEQAIFSCFDLLKSLSIERKFEEFSKILISKQKIYPLLNQYRLFECLNIPYHSQIEDELNHSICDLEIRLACLFNSKQVASKIMKSWHLSNKRIEFVSKLVEYKKIDLKNDAYTIRKCIDLHGIDFTYKLFLFKQVDCTLLNHIVSNKDYLIQLAINGSDCIALGYTGKEIENALNQAKELVYQDLLKNNKDELLKVLRK